MIHCPLIVEGLPKAAVVTHERVWAASFLQAACGVTAEDIFYINLPLYHSAGFLIGMSGAIERGNGPLSPHECGSLKSIVESEAKETDVLIIAGMTIVLRRKFSASQFWDDCRKHDVTVMQYIGETLRYLCNTPKVKKVAAAASVHFSSISVIFHVNRFTFFCRKKTRRTTK